MRAEQISIFLENKPGRLARVIRILAEVGVNIRALSLADTSDFGVLRLIVHDTAKARQALKQNGYTVRSTQVLAVELDDKPGGLLKVLDFLHGKGINIEYMYAYASPMGSNAIMIFRFDEMDRAESILREADASLVNGATLYTI